MAKKKRDILSSKLSIANANRHRKDDLQTFIIEFQQVCQQFIDILWDMDTIPSLLPKDITSQIADTWLSARMLQCCGKQASGIVRSVKTKLKKAEKKREHFLEEHKSVKKLDKTIEKLRVAKPNLTSIQPMLSSQCFAMDWSGKTKFKAWATIHSIGGNMRIVLPLKGSGHLDSLLERGGTLLNSLSVSRKAVTLSVEMPEIPKRETGSVLGVDIGMTEMFHCSDDQHEIADKHGWTLSKVLSKMTRRKYGSKGFKRAQAHRLSFINWSVKQINLDGVAQVNIENLKNVRYKKICSRKHKRWTYGDILRGVERTCAKVGVRTVRLNPAFTSQRCHECGWTHEENRSGKSFRCGRCGSSSDADHNASINLILPLPAITGWQWGEHRKKRGFFWCSIGQEPMVSGVQEVGGVS